MLKPETVHVYLAAGLHLTQFPMMRLIQRRIPLASALECLPPLSRALFRAMMRGIVFYVAGTGLLAAANANALLHSEFGLGLCVLQSVIWTTRVSHQLRFVRGLWPDDTKLLFWTATSIYGALATLYSWFWIAAIAD